jgi:hypothetical protein
VQVGDMVHIFGWRGCGSIDRRIVKRISIDEHTCQTGIMIELDRPLHNGSTFVDLAWTHEYEENRNVAVELRSMP